MERSQQKRITVETRILKFMRVSREKSQRQAGKLVGISGPAIAHIENGRMDISRERLATLIRAYGYSFEEFMEFVEGKPIPTFYREECTIMLRYLKDEQLKIVHGLIQSLVAK